MVRMTLKKNLAPEVVNEKKLVRVFNAMRDPACFFFFFFFLYINIFNLAFAPKAQECLIMGAHAQKDT